jgi:Flp pilus assembly protein TadG
MKRIPHGNRRPGQAGRRSFLRRLLRRDEGQSLVELSFLLPIFLVIAVGVVEVADSMNSYITIIDAARDGARMGSKNLATDDEIRNLVITETGRLRDPVTPSDVTVTHVTQDGVDAIRVRVCNERELLLSIPIVMPDGFTMCSETTMRVLPSPS